ncbi:hypothetical protein HG531_004031 [Fusarium graminearum]|nr:hypothetical protein HG531_004031 [Fusarium graminearum]
MSFYSSGLLATTAHDLGQRSPSLLVGKLDLAKVLIEIEDHLEGVAATTIGTDTGRATLEEGSEALLLPDSLGSVSQAVVCGLALARLDLKSGLDDVAGCREFICWGLAKEVLLEMAVGGEVDGGKGNIAEQTRRSALVQSDETQVAHNPHGRSLRCSFNGLGDLALDLETNLDDLEWVGENLWYVCTSRTTRDHLRPECDIAVLVGERLSGDIVDGELDGLLWGDTDQLRQHTGVETSETFVTDDLLETIYRVLVKTLTRLGASLVLQPCLDQINGVHHEGTEGTSNTTKGKVTQATRGLVKASKVEEDVGFHGSEEREASKFGGLVQKLGASDLSILALVDSAAQDDLNKIHATDDVLECAHVGVVENVLGQLVARGLDNDALKLLTADEAIAVLVKLVEGLSDALALETSQHLAELGVVERVAVLPVTNSAEVIVFDSSSALNVEETEGNLIFGIGLAEKVLKHAPVT